MFIHAQWLHAHVCVHMCTCLFHFAADVIQLHSPRSESSQQQSQQQQENEPLVMEDHVDDSPAEKL